MRRTVTVSALMLLLLIVLVPLGNAATHQVIDKGAIQQIKAKVASDAKLTDQEEALYNQYKALHHGQASSSELDEVGGPDGFGYQFMDSQEADGPTYNWVDISTTGTEITGLGDESTDGPFDIGFSFPFYGTDYTQFYLSSNGFICFDSDFFSSSFNSDIPSTSGPENMIAWFWDDLNPADSDFTDVHVYYEMMNDGTNDYLVISFVNYPDYNWQTDTESYLTAQVLMYDDGRIVLQYNTIGSTLDITSSTIGIENADATDGLRVLYNGSIADYPFSELAIAFNILSADASVSGTVTDAVSGDPLEGAIVTMGTNTDTTDATGAYSFPEVFSATYSFSASAEGHFAYSADGVDIVSGANTYDIAMDPFPAVDILDDFEANGDNWVVYSADPATPLWQWGAPDPAFTDGPAEAHSGSNVYGTNLADDYVVNAADTLMFGMELIPDESSMLSYYHYSDCETGWDGYNVQVRATGDTSWTIINPMIPAGYPDDSVTGLDGEAGFTGHGDAWEMVAFDLSAFAGQTIQVMFRFGSDGSVTYPGAYIDDVEFRGVSSNPLFTGTVTAASDGTPLTDATVTVNDATTDDVVATVGTDANGMYSVRVPEGEYNLTATAPQHVAMTQGPYTVVFGDENTVDFALDEVTVQAVVSGSVLSADDGTGIEGVTVHMFAGTVDVSFTTDANGDFSSGTDTYPVGTYTFEVNADLSASAYHDGTFTGDLNEAGDAFSFDLLTILAPQNLSAFPANNAVSLTWVAPLNHETVPTLTRMAQARRDRIEMAEANSDGSDSAKIDALRDELTRIENVLAARSQQSSELDEVSDFIGYRIQIDGALQDTVIEGTAMTVAGLTNDTEYSFAVAADYGYGDDYLVFSEAVTATPSMPQVYVDTDNPFEWVDIITDGTGTALNLGDDGDSEPITMGGMTMMHFGYAYTELYAGSNGMITFSGDHVTFMTDPIPTEDTPNDFIAPDWEDFDPADNPDEDVYYYVDTDNSRIIVQWRVSIFPGSSTEHNNLHEFEVIIYPELQQYVFNYLSAETWNSDGDAVVGLEDATGTLGYALDPAEVLMDSSSVLLSFQPLPHGTVTGILHDCAEDGTVIAGAEVSVNGSVLDTTGTDGSFSFDIAPGDYTVNFTHPNYWDAEATAAVVVDETTDLGAIVMTAPIPVLSATTVSLAYDLDGTDAATATFDVTNQGCGEMVYVASVDLTTAAGEPVTPPNGNDDQPLVEWLTISPTEGTVEAAGSATFTLTVDPNLDPEFDPTSGEQYFAQAVISGEHMSDAIVTVEIDFLSSVEDGASQMPAKYALHQNYPNPFNPTTEIQFDLVASQRVKLTVFNMLGQEVARLVDGQMQAGFHHVNFDGSQLSSGIYFYRLETPAFTKMRKMVLVK